jgi:ubiquinone/menaquinone biosynthesis C-methylase UbiE
MKEDFGKYFDEYIMKNQIERELIYYSESIEHSENVKKIFNSIGENQDQVILDAGCGIGNFLVLLSKKCKYIYGFDISNESINICKKRIQEENIKNASVQVASLMNIPLSDKSINKIICFSVLHYLTGEETVLSLKEFKRVLKDDGSIIINFVNGSSPWGLSTKLIRIVRQIIKGRKEYSSNYISYKKLIQNIENLKGRATLCHSAYFYPVYFPVKLADWIGNHFYFERFLPGFIQKFGKSITIQVQFSAR